MNLGISFKFPTCQPPIYSSRDRTRLRDPTESGRASLQIGSSSWEQRAFNWLWERTCVERSEILPSSHSFRACNNARSDSIGSPP